MVVPLDFNHTAPIETRAGFVINKLTLTNPYMLTLTVVSCVLSLVRQTLKQRQLHQCNYGKHQQTVCLNIYIYFLKTASQLSNTNDPLLRQATNNIQIFEGVVYIPVFISPKMDHLYKTGFDALTHCDRQLTFLSRSP